MMLFCGAFAMNSCLQYDEPGDELEMNQRLYQYEKPDSDGSADNSTNSGISQNE